MGTRKPEASRRSMLTARPMAMPCDAAMPLYLRTSFRVRGVSFVARSASMLASFYFVEFGVDQLLDRLDRLLLILSIGCDGNDGALAGGEQKDAQDAFAVDFLLAFANFDVRFELRRAINQRRGGSGMNAEFVLDLDVLRDQPPAPARRSADRRSEATRIAFEPFSQMTCASVLTSLASCCIVANFTTIGRLTPVMISTRPFSRNERLMLLGVPPNMSVKMMTPSAVPMRSSARRIFSLASSTVSVHSSGTASMTPPFASIFCAALSSSLASLPWVTINAPITLLPPRNCHDKGSSFEIAVHDLNRVTAGLEIRAEPLGDRDRAMLAARAADSDRQIASHFALITGQQVSHEIEQLRIERVVLRLLLEIVDH